MKIQVKSEKGEVLKVVDLKPTTEAVGNFNPHWVKYKGKKYLVQGGIDYAYMHGAHPLGIEYYITIKEEGERQ